MWRTGSPLTETGIEFLLAGKLRKWGLILDGVEIIGKIQDQVQSGELNTLNAVALALNACQPQSQNVLAECL